MKIFLFLLSILILAGCTSSPQDIDSKYLHYSKGGENITAYSKNPLLKCDSTPKIARLDKKFENRVFISEDGDLCK